MGSNEISVKPRVNATDVQAKIEAAFKRSAENRCTARACRCHGWQGRADGQRAVGRHEAERAAWAAPGVTEIDDRLMITP